MRKYSLDKKVKRREFKFVNRTEIKNIIMNEYNKLLDKRDYFKVISIHGMGGIGKTKLIDEIKNLIENKNPKQKINYISFEISTNEQVLDNLIKIRKQIDCKCYLFDFALILYWENNRSEQLDSNFMNSIKKNFLIDTIDYSIKISPISIPSIIDIINFSDKIIKKFKSYNYKNYFDEIKTYKADVIIDNLPIYLGIDISFASKSCKNIFIFDSYQQSNPYSESKEWLSKLIGTIKNGLFIVTSREKLKWEDEERDIISYALTALPKDTAVELIQYHLNDAKTNIIDVIIKSTECIPIYLDLAIEIYEFNKNSSIKLNEGFFKDRNKFVTTFINHTPEEWHDILIALSYIRIFNKEIFEYIIKKRNYSCPIDDYYELININLINYREKTDNFIKLHDVFHKDGSAILSDKIKYDLFKNYLDYIQKRIIVYDSKNSLEEQITLFTNIIFLEKELSQNKVLDVQDFEKTLDMFFVLYGKKAKFIPIKPNKNYSDSYNDILYFISYINNKKITAKESYKNLKLVKNPNNFGKHKYSYQLILNYDRALLGDYNTWGRILHEIDLICGSSCIEWYEKRSKLYLADYLFMTGKFKKSYQLLLELENKKNNSYFLEDDVVLLYRYMGHIFRFNFDTEIAVKKYNSVFENIKESLFNKIYINTNLCETYCYFKPDYCIKIFNETIEIAKKIKSDRNIAKLYYSKGIAQIVLKNYSGAENNINKSIKINKLDGYKSGELFAYMAKAYLQYAKNKKISKELNDTIDELIDLNNVYLYFRLPLALMNNSEKELKKLEDEFEWINFNETYNNYIKFLNSL